MNEIWIKHCYDKHPRYHEIKILDNVDTIRKDVEGQWWKKVEFTERNNSFEFTIEEFATWFADATGGWTDPTMSINAYNEYGEDAVCDIIYYGWLNMTPEEVKAYHTYLDIEEAVKNTESQVAGLLAEVKRIRGY